MDLDLGLDLGLTILSGSDKTSLVPRSLCTLHKIHVLNVDVCYVNANDSPLFVLFALTLAKREREEGGGDSLQNEGKFVNKFKYIFLFLIK